MICIATTRRWALSVCSSRQHTHHLYKSYYYSSASILSTFNNNSSSSFFIRTPKDEQVVRDLFLSFASYDNTDGDKLQEPPSLNVDDMRDLLLSIGEHPSETKLSQLIDTIDVDKNGKIEYDEFLSGCEAILGGNTSNNEGVNIDKLIDMFRELDADGSGDLTMDELSGLLSTAGVSLNRNEVQDIMSAADVNKDGKICLDEFITLMTDPSKAKYSWRIRSVFRVCLIIGGPGSGKGTLCDKLVQHAHLHHMSSGEMLRNEIAFGSPLAKSIEETMKRGELVSSSTIVALLKKQLRRHPGSLIALDGYPRNKQNYIDFVGVLGNPEFAIYIDVSDEEMIARIMKRAATSGRADDNMDTAKLRLQTFHNETKPTIEQLRLSNIPIYALNGKQTPEKIWEELKLNCPQIATRI